mmetsp:Transcript_73248/g.203180  ORF Transcript_73248/g.203180 Transcript_73248/m.203180 type:complete len:82 (+) Transcript_73248:416-661(+)
MTKIRSTSRTVESRCATMITVRSCAALSMASCTKCSDSASSALVASSRSNNFGSINSARAMATRCFWPPLSRTPRSPTSVA